MYLSSIEYYCFGKFWNHVGFIFVLCVLDDVVTSYQQEYAMWSHGMVFVVVLLCSFDASVCVTYTVVFKYLFGSDKYSWLYSTLVDDIGFMYCK